MSPQSGLAGLDNKERSNSPGYISEIDSGPLEGTSFDYMRSQNSPQIEDVGPIDGPVVFAGGACDDHESVPEATEDNQVALVERGECQFVEKMDNVEGKGYAAVLIFNEQGTASDACDAFPSSMSTSVSIPMLAIERTTGLQLLGEADADAVTCPEGPETQADVGTVGESVFIKAEFDPHSTETGFEQRGGNGWTTPAEETAFLETIAAGSERITYTEVGTSIDGKPIHLVRVGYPQPPSDTEIAEGHNMLIQGTPHGNEPAGQEMSLQLLRDLAFTDDPVLMEQMSDVTILFMPTPNPDGRDANTRSNAWGLDNNRDHLNLISPEAQAVAWVMNEFRPDITIDAHERPSGSSPEMEMVWPRNLNIFEPIRHLSEEMVQDYLFPDVEEAGFTTGVYGSPTSTTNGNERVLSNMLGLRHSVGLITESAGRSSPTERVEMQMATAKSVMRFYRERFDDVVQVVNEAPDYKTLTGANQSEPFYLDGADNRVPDDQYILDPPACGYLLNTSQENEIERHKELFSFETEKVSENGVFVTMGQPMMTVIPFLLDERARYNEVDGLALYDCDDPGSVEPPLGPPSAVNLKILVDRFADEGEFSSDEASRILKTHLLAVERYENEELEEKIVKHMESFMMLLENQRDQGLISEKAYTSLQSEADILLKTWKHAFYYNFEGDNGTSWSASHFSNLHTWPSSPAGAVYSIQDNTGEVIIDERLQGNGSAFGRAAPVMDELGDAELFIRFRPEEAGNNQRLRFWLQADAFTAGSSFPINGYGVELHLGNDNLVLYERTNGSSANLGSIDANITTDWLALRMRVEEGKLMAKLWNAADEEPDDWDIVHEGLEERTGQLLMSFINFDYDSSNSFYFDEVIVDDLDDY